jgi:hypothetical protein
MTFRARAALFAAAFASLAFASGCTHVIQPEGPTGKPAFEVGTGEGEFDTLGPSVAVPINYGIQGGTHIWFAARCKNLGPNAALTYSITDANGAVVSTEQSVMLPSDPGDDGWRTVAGLTAFIDGTVPVTSGMTVVFHGHIEDDDGHVLDATGDAVVDGSAQPGGGAEYDG